MENIHTKETRYSILNDKRRLKAAFESAMILCLVSLFVAGVLISIANDVYAFVKPDRVIKIGLPESHTLNDVARALGREGVINNPTIFVLYVRSKGKASLFEGAIPELELNSNMSYREILSSVSAAKKQDQ